MEINKREITKALDHCLLDVNIWKYCCTVIFDKFVEVCLANFPTYIYQSRTVRVFCERKARQRHAAVCVCLYRGTRPAPGESDNVDAHKRLIPNAFWLYISLWRNLSLSASFPIIPILLYPLACHFWLNVYSHDISQVIIKKMFIHWSGALAPISH